MKTRFFRSKKFLAVVASFLVLALAAVANIRGESGVPRA